MREFFKNIATDQIDYSIPLEENKYLRLQKKMLKDNLKKDDVFYIANYLDFAGVELLK